MKSHFSTNWVDQQNKDGHFTWPHLERVYEAHIKPIRFVYPLSWYEGINVWPGYGGLPDGAEFGYVSAPGWTAKPGAPMGIWFFIGAVPMPNTVCYKEVKLVTTVGTQAVPIKGLTQKVYYCETITSPSYDTATYIANFGLLSVHTPPTVRFSIASYLACHPSADNWFVYDKTTPQTALFQFGGHSFGLIPSEASQAFGAQAEALQFFASQDYKAAKDIILSTTIA